MQSLRFAQRSGVDMLSVIVVNYIVAFLASLAVLLIRGGNFHDASPWIPLGMGSVTGVLFIVSVPFLLGGFGTAGVGVTTATIRAATLIPVLVSWYAFEEPMNSFRWTAIALLVPAMIMIRPRDATRPHLTIKTDLFLLALFVNAGLIQTMHKVAEFNLAGPQEEIYKTTIFGTAAMIASAIVLARRRLPTFQASMFGLMIGLINTCTILFMLKALNAVPAVILFPTVSSLTILINVVLSWKLWDETLLRRQVGGIALAITILCLVNAG
jgi:multidrug transporter EmrE-like cation transporter